jgi:hypothetical protein
MVLVACSATIDAGGSPASVRERLTTETQLQVAATDAGGAITAQRRTDSGWADQRVGLPIVDGALRAKAGPAGTVVLAGLELGLAPVTIPATVFGHEARLTHVHLRLVAPTEMPASWADDDRAHLTATLALQLSWWLEVDGIDLPLGNPRLPPMPLTLDLAGQGGEIVATLRGTAGGEIWSWADLVRLTDLELTVSADSASR